jgi:hypothetical protein
MEGGEWSKEEGGEGKRTEKLLVNRFRIIFFNYEENGQNK